MKLRLFAILVLLSPALLVGQTFRGTILGAVSDPSGNFVAGATVVVHNNGTGLERTAVTGAGGTYTIAELPVGTYSVTVTQSGFQKSVTSDVEVDVATERRVDVQLKIGQVTQTVEVSASDLPMVETTTNELGGVITAEVAQDLPVNGRDYTKLIYLNPGVAGSPDQISDSPGSFGEFSMNGARGRSNNYLLDGTDMNDGYRNDPAINQAGVFGTPATILPIDAVAEVNVLSNFKPEYGRNAGGVVNIVTKSGSNQIHGTAGEYMRNDALDARNYFNIASQPKALFHNNQFGASVGGPIVKNKTFFYVDYEGQQEPVGVVTISSVPTGDCVTCALKPSDATDPSGVIQKLLARNPWPAPNLGGGVPIGQTINGITGPTPGTASVISPSYNDLTSMIVKIDQNFSTNNILTGRYYFGDSVQSFPLALAAGGGELPGYNTFTPTRVQLASLSYVHTFGTDKVNELRYGWNRFAEGFYPVDQAFHPSSIGLCSAIAITGPDSCNQTAPYDSGLPVILVSGVAQIGANSGDPRNRIDSNDQILDNFSWKLNKHDFKFGIDYYRTTVTQPDYDRNFRGKLTFNGDPADGSPTGSGIGDFLAGYIDSGYDYYGNAARHTSENSFGLYFQDGYRMTRRFTLNYGMRWDYMGVIGEKNNLLANVTSFGPATGPNAGFTLTQVGQPGLSQLYNPDHKDFAPRLSIAWDATGKGKTVVRAGYGLFFDASSQDMVIGHFPYSPSFDPGPAFNNATTFPSQDLILKGNLTQNAIASGQALFAPPSSPSACGECDVFAFDRNIKTPYMENYNLNIQQQLTSKTVIQLGYVGSQGHRLWRFFDLSQPSVAEITASDCPNGAATIPCPGGAITPSYGVPRNYIGGNYPYGAFYLLQENSTGKSNYNALQLSLRLNSWHGMTSVVNYVYSKSLDNSSDGEDFEPNAAQPNDSNNPQKEYGPSNFNIPQRFTWNISYELPKHGGDWQRLKNGWGLDSVLSLQDGQPFQLNYNFEDDYSGGGNGFDRPDVVGPIKYSHNPFNYLDLSSFAIPCTVTGSTGFASDCVPGTRHYGDEGRDSLHGPSFKEWNFAIFKNTSITERVKMQFRADFFNLPNHPNFANPFLPNYIADPGVAGFTTATVNNALREVGAGPYQISATGDVGIGNPFIGGGGPRGIQLAVKFSF